MFRGTLILVMTLVFASGCTVKLTYNNLDRLVRWQVGEYVDFDEQQRNYFRQELDYFLYWHRTSELPKYADLADEFAGALDKEIEVRELERIYAVAEQWALDAEQQTQPMTIELMRSMSDEQVAELPAKLAESNEDFVEREADLTLLEAQERWQKNVADGLKFFAGRIDRAQRDYIASQAVRYVPEFALWGEYRERWQQEFLAALEYRQDEARFTAAYRRLVNERESFWGEEFAEISEANEVLGKEVLAGLLARLTDRQRERFKERLQSLASDFRELVAEAEAPKPREHCLLKCPVTAAAAGP